MMTLQEIHKLYLLLRDYLPEKEEKYLLDELIAIFERAEPGTISKCLEIMYPSRQPRDTLDGVKMFVEGIKKNEFFEYVSFVNTIKHARRSSKNPTRN